MKFNLGSRTAALAALLLLAVLSGTSRGQILGAGNSNVEGYFGATSDAFQQAEGPSIPPWTANGPGFYPITGPPNVPQLYPGFPTPAYPVTSSIPFIPTPHSTLSTPFTDGTTTAGYAINGGVDGAGTLAEDAFLTGDTFDITVQNVPEPSSVVLLGLGLAGLGFYAVRRRKAAAV